MDTRKIGDLYKIVVNDDTLNVKTGLAGPVGWNFPYCNNVHNKDPSIWKIVNIRFRKD
jgi:hypothetical protein